MRVFILSSLLGLGVTLSALPAQAWDPNEGAEPVIERPSPRFSERVIPRRYYRSSTAGNVAIAPGAVIAPGASPTPIQAAAPAPLPTPAPVALRVPIENPRVIAPPPISAVASTVPEPLAPLPVEVSPPPVIAAAAPIAAPAPVQATPIPPIARAPASYTPPARQAYAANRFSIGIEGFYDHYEEPDTFPDLNNNAGYGSVELGYARYISSSLYLQSEGRASYGRNRYKSSQGYIADVPQWEFETRFLGGFDAPVGRGGRFKTYLGLGGRYFIDDGKGGVTNIVGASAYERRIYQLYLPIGVTYEFMAYGLNFAPNIEIDPLLYGHVESRLQNIDGFEEARNRQNKGLGVRGEFLVGQSYPDGWGWKFGPFVRYWDVDDSKLDTNAAGTFFEPRNTRVQAGAKLKVTF